MKNFIIFLISFVLLCSTTYAGEIKAIKTNESFQEVAHIDRLEQIRINTVPRTTYTPKNLRSQYMMSFQGRDNNNTAIHWSNTFTDYDTKVIKSLQEGDSYYIEDNTGARFKTGEHVDLTPIQNNMQTLNQRMDGYGQDISRLDNKINDVQKNVYTGLATVTALTSLHPNPRSTSFAEVSLGAGVFRDQCAGAAGLFLHPTNWSMLQGGFAFGNQDNYAGFVGMTFNIPPIRFKKK
jgi:autotransporter adhesin